MRRLPVILDIDTPGIERPSPAAPAWNTDGIENQHFVRLRPRDCEDASKPCPWKECRYRIESQAHPEVTCAIDVADEGPLSLMEVAKIFGVTDVAIARAQRRAFRKLTRARWNEVRTGRTLNRG